MSTYTVSGITYDTASGRPITSDGSFLLDSERQASSNSTNTTSTTSTTTSRRSKKFSPLRYPNSRIDTDSDYLEIRVVEYQPPGFELGDSGPLSLGTSTDALQENFENPLGFIFLPIPENIQDSNAVGWGDDNINGLAAAGVNAVTNTLKSGKFVEGLFKSGKDFTGRVTGALGDNSSQVLASSFFASRSAPAFTKTSTSS